MKVSVYHLDKSVAGDRELEDRVFGVRMNADLLHQVVRSLQLNQRKPIAHAKSRGEVSGGGKKPWKQKGTGRARHGSTRSPLWRKGGVTHGPRNERIFTTTVPSKMKRQALRVALSAKAAEGNFLVVSDELASHCTTAKRAQQAFDVFLKHGKKHARALFVCEFTDAAQRRGIQNLPFVRWVPPSGVAILEVVQHPLFMITESALAILTTSLKK